MHIYFRWGQVIKFLQRYRIFLSESLTLVSLCNLKFCTLHCCLPRSKVKIGMKWIRYRYHAYLKFILTLHRTNKYLLICYRVIKNHQVQACYNTTYAFHSELQRVLFMCVASLLRATSKFIQ